MVQPEAQQRKSSLCAATKADYYGQLNESNTREMDFECKLLKMLVKGENVITIHFNTCWRSIVL